MTIKQDIFFSLMCFQGMAISVLGPTLEDLATNVNKNISNLSYIFVGRSSGYAGGSLLGGILFDFVNPHLLLGKALENKQTPLKM